MTAPTKPVSGRFREIPGFSGYGAAKNGDIARRLIGGWKLVRGFYNPGGYKRVSIKGKGRMVSRLILLTFVGPCPAGMECCHYNGRRDDNRLSNLRWDTRASNAADTRRHGTYVRGEKVVTHRLTEKQVREIRKRIKAAAGKEHWGRIEMCRKFNVSKSAVYNAAHGISWQSVK